MSSASGTTSTSYDSPPVIAHGSIPVPSHLSCKPTNQSDRLLLAAFKNLKTKNDIKSYIGRQIDIARESITQRWEGKDGIPTNDSDWRLTHKGIRSVAQDENERGELGSLARDLGHEISAAGQWDQSTVYALKSLDLTVGHLLHMAGHHYPHHGLLEKIDQLAHWRAPLDCENASDAFLSRLESTLRSAEVHDEEDRRREDTSMSQANYIMRQQGDEFRKRMEQIAFDGMSEGGARAARTAVQEALQDPNTLTAENYHPPATVINSASSASAVFRDMADVRQPDRRCYDFNLLSSKAARLEEAQRRRSEQPSTRFSGATSAWASGTRGSGNAMRGGGSGGSGGNDAQRGGNVHRWRE